MTRATDTSEPMEVLLALGANLGDPIAQLRSAIQRLGSVVQLDAVSSVYVTEPVGFTEQPDFYNLVARGRTDLPVYDLFAQVQRIEAELGRERSLPNAPRRIDIDLLAYGALALLSDRLTVPHPRMNHRTFVLLPLAEIAPEWRHPLTGTTAWEALHRLAVPTRAERWGPLPQ